MESIPVMLYKKCIVICWFINWIPSTEGKKRQNKEADHFENHSKSETLISKEIYIWRLPWASTRRVIFSPTHWHLKSLYRIFNWVRTHAQSKRYQSLLSQSYVLETMSSVETVGSVLQRTGKGMRRLWSPTWVNWFSHSPVYHKHHIIFPVALVTKFNRNSHLCSWNI